VTRKLTVRHGAGERVLALREYSLPGEPVFRQVPSATSDIRTWLAMLLGGSAALAAELVHPGLGAGLGPVGVVTTTATTAIVSALAGSPTVDVGSFHWHAAGSGTAPESPADMDLDLALPVPRANGSREMPAGNVYRTKGTIMFDDTYTVTEWGLFSASSGGVLFDRAVIDPIPVIWGHWIVFTCDYTFNPWG
jgi:hypothetical protein